MVIYYQGVSMKVFKTARSVNCLKTIDDQSEKVDDVTNEDGVKTIESEYHTLFVSKVDRTLEEFQTEYNGEILTAVKESVPEHKKYTLYIESFGHTKNQLHKIVNELRQAQEFDILELRIDSPGGYISEGIMVYNTMRELFNERTITYLDSTGFSMGAVIFSLGDERIIYEDSSLMYHNYSTGYVGKGDEIKSYIDFEDRHFREFFVGKIVNKGFMSREEYKEMSIGKDFWFDSLEMAKRNICTAVIVGGYKLDNEAFIQFKAQDKPIAEWVAIKLKEIELENEKVTNELVKEAEKEQKRKEKILKEAEKLVSSKESEVVLGKTKTKSTTTKKQTKKEKPEA
jgi:ATP-dependent protease ClpP protease subunit